MNRLKKIFGQLFVVRRRRVVRRMGGAMGRKGYLVHKESARELVMRKIAEWNALYGFTVGRVSIKNQTTRWGSCSSKGNLNFNYRIALLPEHLADYIIVHELCHLKEFNHSQKFWDLVGKAIPDYAVRREELRKIAVTKLARV